MGIPARGALVASGLFGQSYRLDGPLLLELLGEFPLVSLMSFDLRVLRLTLCSATLLLFQLPVYDRRTG